VDQSRLGFITSNLLLAFHGFSAEARTRLLGLISTCEGIGWATGVGGDFDYEVSYLARTVQDLGSFGRSFPGDFGIRVSRREMAIEYAQTFFGVRFRDEQDLEGGFTLCKAENAITLNPTDQRIVCAVTHGHGVSLREIAQACGLPQTTVQYRMKRLEEEGVIRSPVYSVKLSKLGLARHHVLLTVSNSSKSLHESLFNFCSRKAGVYALIVTVHPAPFFPRRHHPCEKFLR